MTNNKKAARAGTPTTSNTAFNASNHTAIRQSIGTTIDPLTGWFSLAKPSRNRQPKRGKQRGRIEPCLAGQLVLLAVIVLLLVGGVML